jgi:hypothetical protein
MLLVFLVAITAASLAAQPPATAPTTPQDYVCPMDKDVRSDKPGFCPRCHMKLVLGIPDEEEYPLELKLAPAAFQAGEKVKITFQVKDPHTGKLVDHFELVHIFCTTIRCLNPTARLFST